MAKKCRGVCECFIVKALESTETVMSSVLVAFGFYFIVHNLVSKGHFKLACSNTDSHLSDVPVGTVFFNRLNRLFDK